MGRLSPFSRSWHRYAAAAALVAFATALRLWPLQAIGTGLAWLTFYPAVAVAALLGGFYAGVLAAALYVVAAIYFLPVFVGGPLVHDYADLLGMAVFVLTGVIVSWMARAMHRAIARARSAERRIDERFNLYMDAVRDYAVIALDRQGRVATWNAGAERIKGYGASEIIGRHFSVFYEKDDVEAGKPERALKTAGEKGRFEDEGWRVRKDGTRFWADVVISALHDEKGGHTGYLKITRDVTERREAETLRDRLMADLRAAVADANRHRAQFEAVFEAMQDGLVVFDGSGNVTLVNEAEARINGFASASEMKRDMAFFAAVYELKTPDGRVLPVEEWPVSRIGRGETLRDVELVGRRKDTGREWYFSFSGSLIRDEAGGPYLAVTVTRDVTARKQAEEALGRLTAELERRVVERTAELEAAVKELEAFSYSVSHDLRTPLRAIDGFSKILIEDYSDKLDDKGKDWLRRVRAATQRMGQLIDDMLNLSRVSRKEMAVQDVDLSAEAAAIAEDLKRADPGRDVTFSIAPGLKARGDARLLRVVMDNLMHNAWKFTSKHPKALIEFGAREDGGVTTYYVRDDGAGFDMAYAARLFGVFQRLHAANEFDGTGIGLATVQRIVRRHGGKVWAEGEVEKGAAVYFTLP